MTQSDSTTQTSSESTTSQLKIYRGDRTESYGKKIYTQLEKLSVPLEFKEKVGFVLPLEQYEGRFIKSNC